MFEMYHARLTGMAHCIVPQQLPIAVDPQSTLMNQPSMELLASIMKPNQPMTLGGNQMPSIVQIIVPASSLQQVAAVLNHTEEEITSTSTSTTTTTTSSTTTTTIAPDFVDEESSNETVSEQTPSEAPFLLSTIEPLRSSIPVSQSTTPMPEPESNDDIDDIQLNEDLENGEDYQENEEKIKKQRDRSDFKYVETFESEKSPARKFDPDPDAENDTDDKNVINENFQQQIPSVLPVPKALSSSSKDAENEDHEPPEMIQDQNLSAPEM
jgi:hypothetical protein